METVAENPYQDRYKDAPWANPKLDIMVGGAGGIGSWLLLFLSRLGTNNIVVYDDDTIEAHNIGGQLYKTNQIGQTKVDAMSQIVKEFSDFDIITMPYKHGPDAVVSDVVFSAFDNMEARKNMSKMWFEKQLQKRRDGTAKPEDVNIFIDGRMEAEQAIIYAVNSVSDYERYKSELFDDSEVDLGPCSFRATTHNGARIASEMVTILTNSIFNKKMGGNFRQVPYKVTYELPTMTYNIEQ